MIHLLALTAAALDNGLAKTPQMGWNSWNKFGCNVSEALIRATADRLRSLGLAEKGYRYVNIDDCWQISRDNSTRQIQADPSKFPHGMKSLADYVHGLGLFLGLYSDSGYLTCQRRPGSFDHEEIDAQTYAAWGVDYLKYDNCFTNGEFPLFRYKKMRDALNKTGRPIFYSMCEWGVDLPQLWAPEVANSWRTTGDISDSWQSVLHILDKQKGLERHAGPGGWNDPDMLEVGNGGMTPTEYQSHFALWAVLKAPLLIGCDLQNISAETLAILGNEEVIAVNQDPLGQQAKFISEAKGLKDSVQLFGGKLSGGATVALILNRDVKPNNFSLDLLGDLGLRAPVRARDLIGRRELGVFNQRLARVGEVESHGCLLLRLEEGGRSE